MRGPSVIEPLVHVIYLVWSASDSAASVIWASEALLIAGLLIGVLDGTAGTVIDNVALVDSVSIIALYGLLVEHVVWSQTLHT